MELDRETIEKLIRQAFPQATVISSRLLESKSLNSNYALQLQNPSAEIVLRIYRPGIAQHTVEKEMHVLRVVMPETGVPTFRVIHFDTAQTIIDSSYAVLNLLPGEPLENALPRMDELDLEATGYEMGRYLAKLHTIPLQKYGEFMGRDPLTSNNEKTYTLARLMEWLELCEQHRLLDSSIITELQSLASQTLVLDRSPACFVHGNYHQRNIKVQEGVAGFHVTGVFNFEDAQGWSPEWDMTNLFGCVFDDYPAMIQGFLDGYVDTGELPEKFWDRLRIYRHVRNVYRVLCAHRAGNETLLKTKQEQLHHFVKNKQEGY